MRSIIDESALECAVKAICPHVFERIDINSNDKLNEETLWEELICCILSSQVSYEVAQAATFELVKSGLIGLTPNFSNFRKFEEDVRALLQKPLRVRDRNIRYRFPNVRAQQIVQVHKTVSKLGGSLSKIVYEVKQPQELRDYLIEILPGIGPKQASMFLRNIGISYDLAILDRHVLNYMHATNIVTNAGARSFGKREYLSTEMKLLKYAEELGYPVGCVDWAIWIVMRVAIREGYV